MNQKNEQLCCLISSLRLRHFSSTQQCTLSLMPDSSRQFAFLFLFFLIRQCRSLAGLQLHQLPAPMAVPDWLGVKFCLCALYLLAASWKSLISGAQPARQRRTLAICKKTKVLFLPLLTTNTVDKQRVCAAVTVAPHCTCDETSSHTSMRRPLIIEHKVRVKKKKERKKEKQKHRLASSLATHSTAG